MKETQIKVGRNCPTLMNELKEIPQQEPALIYLSDWALRQCRHYKDKERKISSLFKFEEEKEACDE